MTRYAIPLIMAMLAIPLPAKAAMNDAQKKEVEALIKQYILENGDVLIEGVNRFQAKQEEEANKEAQTKAKDLLESLKGDKNVAQAGNPKGDVTVVEFFDYNCGYCKKAFSEVQSLLKDDKNVRVILYDMPILSADSHEISRWAMASRNQGKYFEFHSLLMQHQGATNEETLKKIAKQAGLDADKLKKDKDSPEIEEEIQKHLAVAQSLGIQGTPGFLINEQIFRGYIPYDAMKDAIAKERENLTKKK